MIVLTIAGMALITFGLRLIPLLLSRRIPPQNGIRGKLMEYMPLAVLSALTVPGIFQVDPDSPIIGIASGASAVILVLIRKNPLLLVVLGSVATAVVIKFITVYL